VNFRHRGLACVQIGSLQRSLFVLNVPSSSYPHESIRQMPTHVIECCNGIHSALWRMHYWAEIRLHRTA
jgi:hypothetical protein